MRAIIIGAGRGRRLMPTTANTPKCFAEIGGRRILDWIVAALRSNGVDDIVFIGGYQIDKARAEYPESTSVHNSEWENNNILLSLMYAREYLDQPVFTTYSDILYTGAALGRLAARDEDIAMLVDTGWAARYEGRTEHPPTDGEKVTVANGLVTRVHRDIDPALAYGEFTGILRLSKAGAQTLTQHFDRCKAAHAGGPFREAAVFEKAYLIHLLQEMLDAGVPMTHADTPGQYWEIDTQQDFSAARSGWDAAVQAGTERDA